jgi:hypothetical protein
MFMVLTTQENVNAKNHKVHFLSAFFLGVIYTFELTALPVISSATDFFRTLLPFSQSRLVQNIYPNIEC